MFRYCFQQFYIRNFCFCFGLSFCLWRFYIGYFLLLVDVGSILYPEFTVVASGFVFSGIVVFLCVAFSGLSCVYASGCSWSNSISGILYYCFHVLLRLSDRLYRCLCG